MATAPAPAPHAARAVLLAGLLAAVAVTGCLQDVGLADDTQWAYDVTQLRAAAGTGQGVRVAILDTGIDIGHVNFAHLRNGDNADGELVDFEDFLSDVHGADNAFDDNGHGTHVTSILTSQPSSTSQMLRHGAIHLEGGANAVQLYVARVCGQESCDGRAILDAIDWAIRKNVQVLSLSLGGADALLGLEDDALRAAVNRAVDRGIVVVAAAGNGGPGASADAQRDDVAVPADVPAVIAVAAVDDNLAVADFSSRGVNGECRGIPLLGSPTGRCYPDRKPEISAPGVGILGAWPGDSYARASGTSQATPVVTAAVALMLEGRAPLQDANGVARLKRALVDTASPVPGQNGDHDDAAGYGLLQAANAQTSYR